MLRHLHRLEKAAEHYLFKSDFYPLFLPFSHSFPNHSSQQGRHGILQPLPITQPPGDTAAPAWKQRKGWGPEGRLPKPVADFSKASPVPAVEARAGSGPTEKSNFLLYFLACIHAASKEGSKRRPEAGGKPHPELGVFPTYSS